MTPDRFTAWSDLARSVVVLMIVIFFGNVSARAQQCSVEVVSPKAGEVYVPGTVLSIEWEYIGSCECSGILIDFSDDLGKTWSTVVITAPTTSGYKWTVPDVSSTGCQIRVCCSMFLNPYAYCGESGVFIIIPDTPCGIDVIEPPAGASYVVGEPVPIRWESDCDCSMNIEYSVDAGSSWSLIIADVAPSDQYDTWVAPDVTSDECYIRVACEDGSADGISGFFRITSPEDCRVVGDIAAISLNYRQGCPLPQKVSILLSSTCDGEIPFTVGLEATWLSLEPLGGTTPQEVVATADVADLASGVYRDTVEILYDGPESPMRIPVQLEVTANSRPQLQWTTSSDIPSHNTVVARHGTMLSITFKGQDDDGDLLDLEAITDLPEGAVLAGDGVSSVVLIWNPVTACDGRFDFGMAVSDGCLADTVFLTIDVANSPPTITSNCDVVKVVERDSVICDIHISDDDNGELDINYRGVPSGARFRLLAGAGARLEYETGWQDVDSTYKIVIDADDGCVQVSDTITIIVENMPLQAEPPTGDERYVLIDGAPIMIQFNEPVQETSLAGNASASSIKGDNMIIEYDSTAYRLLVNTNRLYLNELDTITVTLERGIIDEAGHPLKQDYYLDFYTGVGVYPGDANDDGRVDERDIFPIGFYWHKSGPARADRDLAWHLAPAHVTTQISSWDPLEGVYADADGSGTVDADDICAIAQNWTFSKSAEDEGGPLRYLAKVSDDVMKQLYDAALDCPEGAGKQVVLSILDNATGGGGTVDVLPQQVELYVCYPNPFNARSSIRFYLPRSQKVQLTIFNLLGQKTATLIDGQLAAGYHVADWNGRDHSGDEVGSGIYFYSLQTNGKTITKRMLLLK